jgi:hypothetical protein
VRDSFIQQQRLAEMAINCPGINNPLAAFNRRLLITPGIILNPKLGEDTKTMTG